MPKKYEPRTKSNNSRTSSKKRRITNINESGVVEDVLSPTSNSYYTSSKPSVPKNTEFTYQAQPITMNNAQGKAKEDYKIHALEENPEVKGNNRFLKSQSTLKTP